MNRSSRRIVLTRRPAGLFFLLFPHWTCRKAPAGGGPVAELVDASVCEDVFTWWARKVSRMVCLRHCLQVRLLSGLLRDGPVFSGGEPVLLDGQPQRLGVLSRKVRSVDPYGRRAAGRSSFSLPLLELVIVLVLSRKVGEQIMIGDKIVITILDIAGGRVRVGIDAPRDVAVHRMEIHRELARQGRVLLSDPVNAPTADAA